MTKPKVFIYPGDSYMSAIQMFTDRGFEVVKDFEKVDLICFLGGTDVNPTVYGEERGPYTQSPDIYRDEIEVGAYWIWKDRGVPMVGICRGGQLLNVLNGGKMLQHIGLVSGIVMMETPEYTIPVLVDHHQGIYFDGENCDIVGWHDTGMIGPVGYAGYYRDTKSLCFQAHPEWGHRGTEDYFFELIEEYLGLKGI